MEGFLLTVKKAEARPLRWNCLINELLVWQSNLFSIVNSFRLFKGEETASLIKKLYSQNPGFLS